MNEFEHFNAIGLSQQELLKTEGGRYYVPQTLFLNQLVHAGVDFVQGFLDSFK